MFQIQSRPAIMESARQAYLSGKTVDDCPEKFKPWEKAWRYEYQQCAFEMAANGQEAA
jgi:hypothetical protein